LRGIAVDKSTHSKHTSRGGKAYPKEVCELVVAYGINGEIRAIKTLEAGSIKPKEIPKSWDTSHVRHKC
jgi:hypothetical protein